MAYFPLMVDLKDKRILIIGGGETAARKAELMQDFGAEVTVIARNFLCSFPKEAELIEKSFEKEDILSRAPELFLIIAATDERTVNEEIAGLSRELRIPVNVVDDEPLCSFTFPAVIREDDVVVSVSSGGKSPLVTQYVKKRIKEILPPDIGYINEEMGRLRKKTRETVADQKERREVYKEALSNLLNKNS